MPTTNKTSLARAERRKLEQRSLFARAGRFPDRTFNSASRRCRNGPFRAIQQLRIVASGLWHVAQNPTDLRRPGGRKMVLPQRARCGGGLLAPPKGKGEVGGLFFSNLRHQNVTCWHVLAMKGCNLIRLRDGSQMRHAEEVTYLGGVLTKQKVNIASKISCRTASKSLDISGKRRSAA